MIKYCINKREIGNGYPVYIIAEISANHNQKYSEAVKLIHAAKQSGADAVKLQTYTPDTLTINCNNKYFTINDGLWKGSNLYALYSKSYTPWEWQPKLKIVANKLGLDLFSTPFDSTSVDFLEEMGVPAYKISSFEIIDIPLILKIAQTGKPIILSTGMASIEEIWEALQTIRSVGNDQIVLLKCNSGYPAQLSEMNLKTIPNMANLFQTPIGLSDHTLSTIPPIVAVTLGACIIEKHFTLTRDNIGFDNAFSLEPHEFKAMVDSVRQTEMSLGNINYTISKYESSSKVFRKSLFVVKDIKLGELFTSENIRSIRPGYGLLPKIISKIIGQRASVDIACGTPLNWRMVGEK
jgi:pseudaminic acid synthase